MMEPEVSPFPPRWREIAVQDLIGQAGLFTDGDWILAEDLKSGREVRLLQLGDVGVGTFHDRTDKWISGARFAELGCTDVLPGDLLISRMAEPIARACIVPELPYTCITAVDVAILRISDYAINPRYIMHALNAPAFTAGAEAKSSGTTRKRISRKNLGTLTVPLPPREEQDRVVEALEKHLGTVSDGVRHFEDALAGLSRFRMSLLHAELGRADWPQLPLGSVGAIASGLTKGRRTTAPVQDYAFMRAANLRDGFLDLDEVKFIEATAQEAAKLRLESGDCLLVEGSGSPGRLGQGWLWEGQIEECLHQNHVFRARPDHSLILPRFLAWALQAPAARTYFLGMAKTTSGLATINKKQVSALPVPVPSLIEQREVVARLDAATAAAEQETTALKRQLQAAESLRKTLFHAALNGRLTGTGSGEPVDIEALRASSAERLRQLKRQKKTRAVLVTE